MIAGFVPVVPGTLRRDDFSNVLRRFPPSPLPVLILARMGISVNRQRMGLGERLVAKVLELALGMARDLGCVGVLVDAKLPARGFYERYDFGVATRAVPTRRSPRVPTDAYHRGSRPRTGAHRALGYGVRLEAPRTDSECAPPACLSPWRKGCPSPICRPHAIDELVAPGHRAARPRRTNGDESVIARDDECRLCVGRSIMVRPGINLTLPPHCTDLRRKTTPWRKCQNALAIPLAIGLSLASSIQCGSSSSDDDDTAAGGATAGATASETGGSSANGSGGSSATASGGTVTTGGQSATGGRVGTGGSHSGGGGSGAAPQGGSVATGGTAAGGANTGGTTYTGGRTASGGTGGAVGDGGSGGQAPVGGVGGEVGEAGAAGQAPIGGAGPGGEGGASSGGTGATGGDTDAGAAGASGGETIESCFVGLRELVGWWQISTRENAAEHVRLRLALETADRGGTSGTVPWGVVHLALEIDGALICLDEKALPGAYQGSRHNCGDVLSFESGGKTYRIEAPDAPKTASLSILSGETVVRGPITLSIIECVGGGRPSTECTSGGGC